MLRHLARLWGFTVRLEEVDDAKVVNERECVVERRVLCVQSLESSPPDSYYRPIR